MLKRSTILSIAAALLMAGCATKPPVQEMAEARSALKAAQELEGGNAKADQQLKSAEASLQEAAEAIEQELYERARRKALEAKRQAQQAARMKQAESGD